ncbi:hypothetical protein DH2020_011756 [Rehmannia glutinosa]|uniref:ATP-dependent DNA helicase n=1 Tax=Rehmannia glutinosa TaxID=99300 RepID=A0ABR0XE95_REHGL
MGVLGTIARNLDALVGLPFWPYMKLVFCLWLVLPIFNGAAYIYENLVRKYVKVGSHVSSNHPEGQRRVLQMMSLDARKSVEKYIEKYGPEAFDRVVKAAPFELKNIVELQKGLCNRPTGVAACALNGQTLHSFAGLGIGDLDRQSLLDRVLLDRRACYRWKKVKALIIDETSMVDANLFDSLEHIARTLRDDETNELDKKIWGGIQLIVSGDFFQLPPVLKRTKKNDKVYAFEADCWSASFDLQIELTTVFRQSDSLLIQLLQGIRKGENDPEDLKLLEGCCSGYEPDPSAVRLYPRIADVNKVNLEKMKSLENKVYVYKAQDLGDEQWMRQLKSGIAPDELEICVGARVMLIKNINPWRKLVNGATGTVMELCKVSENQYGMSNMCDHGDVLPFVKFDSGLELVVEPEEWVVMDGDKVVARRRQIPLILSWALSIHKCQGMTLDKLHTDLSRVFDFGMVYVALFA